MNMNSHTHKSTQSVYVACVDKIVSYTGDVTHTNMYFLTTIFV